VKALLVVAALALFPSASQAASDCFEPLRENTGWRCHADVPGGPPVDYCLERTHAFGNEPAERTFKIVASGPYLATCSCNAKGTSPGAAFGEDKGFICLYRDTDGVMTGKITKRRIAGQTFTPLYGIRSVFSCEPDPACDVPAVLDPDLPGKSGFVELLPGETVNLPVTAGGPVDVAYQPGCGGYTSEAPNMVYHVDPIEPGEIEVSVPGGDVRPESLLVMTPAGAVHCVDYYVYLPLEAGAYRAWVVLPTPGTLSTNLQGAYRTE
jgi:hypothetical protein